MNKDATMNEKASKYEGMSREECREKLVEELKEKDLLNNENYIKKLLVDIDRKKLKEEEEKLRLLRDH